MEAALSLGHATPLALRRVVLPQAFRIALPSVTNDFIALLKDSSLVSVITVVELTKRMTITAVDTRSWLFSRAALRGLLYFAMSYPLSRLRAAARERGWRGHDRSQAADQDYGDRDGPRGVSATFAKGRSSRSSAPRAAARAPCCAASTASRTSTAARSRRRRARSDPGGARQPRGAASRPRRVGMVFQQWNLFAHRTALGNVIEAPVHVKGAPRRGRPSARGQLLAAWASRTARGLPPRDVGR
jgi:hypothetical protein